MKYGLGNWRSGSRGLGKGANSSTGWRWGEARIRVSLVVVVMVMGEWAGFQPGVMNRYLRLFYLALQRGPPLTGKFDVYPTNCLPPGVPTSEFHRFRGLWHLDMAEKAEVVHRLLENRHLAFEIPSVERRKARSPLYSRRMFRGRRSVRAQEMEERLDLMSPLRYEKPRIRPSHMWSYHAPAPPFSGHMNLEARRCTECYL